MVCIFTINLAQKKKALKDKYCICLLTRNLIKDLNLNFRIQKDVKIDLVLIKKEFSFWTKQMAGEFFKNYSYGLVHISSQWKSSWLLYDAAHHFLFYWWFLQNLEKALSKLTCTLEEFSSRPLGQNEDSFFISAQLTFMSFLMMKFKFKSYQVSSTNTCSVTLDYFVPN